MAINETRESLKKKIDEEKFKIAVAQSQRQEYMNKADEMRRVYEKLAEDKRNVEGQRNFMNQIRGNKFDDFKGDVYNNRYLSQIDNTINAYDRVISGIDANMDTLNWKIAEVQNDAYNCDGLIGYLEKGVNDLNTWLENAVN